jgi:hypothetical protein
MSMQFDSFRTTRLGAVAMFCAAGGGAGKEGKWGNTSHTQAMDYTTPVRGWYNKARVAASVTRVRA